MRLVFWGTPNFSVPSLEALSERSRHQIVGVVTGPDRPQGRGLRTLSTAVKQTAIAHNYPLWQPENLSDPSFLDELAMVEADLFVVVAFRILPAELLKIPPAGIINLHPSLLPRYRGAAPIQWAIINGDKETGVTTFLIKEKVDTGDILDQKSVLINPEETSGDLHDRLSLIGADLVVRTVDFMESGESQQRPQPGKITPAPKISKADARSHWRESARIIHNKVRGLNPIPMSFTTWRGKLFRVIRSSLVTNNGGDSGYAPGIVIEANEKRGIIVQTGDGCLNLLVVQPEGKNQMKGTEFVQGYHPSVGDQFGM